MNKKRIILISGERQVGKSTLCRRTAQTLRESGVQVTGLLTRHAAPHQLEVTEIHTGAQYLLTYPFDSPQGIKLRHFRMNPQALARSADALSTSFPTQVFLLDELGPLELKMKRGWVQALTLLKAENYNVALIVVRPELLINAICILPNTTYTVIQVTEENRNILGDVVPVMAHGLCSPPEIQETFPRIFT